MAEVTEAAKAANAHDFIQVSLLMATTLFVEKEVSN